MSDQKIKVMLELDPELYKKAVTGGKYGGLTVEEWIIELIESEENDSRITLQDYSPSEADVVQLPDNDTDVPQ